MDKKVNVSANLYCILNTHYLKRSVSIVLFIYQRTESWKTRIFIL